MDLTTQVQLLDGLLVEGVRTTFPDPLSERERVSVRAYLVLGHACIEEHIEGSFGAFLQHVMAYLGRSSVPTGVAALMFSAGHRLPEGKRVAYKTRTLGNVAEAYRPEYEKLIAANHGIKSHNIRRMAEGAGLPWARLDEELQVDLAALDTLGAKRGKAGHTSPFSAATLTVSEEIYPEDAREWVGAGCVAAIRLEAYLRRALWTSG